MEALKGFHGLKREVYGMEPTANYHKPLGEYLIRKGWEVVLVSGSRANSRVDSHAKS